MKKKGIILFFALLISVNAPLNAVNDFPNNYTRQRVVIFPIYEKPKLTNKFAEEFKRFLEIEVIDLKEVNYAIQKSGFKSYELLNVKNATKIGKQLNADLVIFTDCEINPLLTSIFTGLVGVKDENLIKTEIVTGKADEAEDLITRMVFRIMNKRYYLSPLKGYPKIHAKDPGYQEKTGSKPSNSSWIYDSIPFDELTFVDAKQFPIDLSLFFWLSDNESLLGLLKTKSLQTIVVFNTESGSYKILNKNKLDKPIIALSLAPDNRRIAFSTEENIFLVDTEEGSNITKLTKGAFPSWSSNSGKLTYQASARESEIWVYDIKNKRKRKVVGGSKPCWLENGTEIIAKYSLKKPSVTIINELQVTRSVKGRQAIPLVNLLGRSNFGGEKIPFSPNGRLYLSRKNGKLVINDLWHKKFEQFLVLGNSISLEKGSIAWSRDGSKVAFREFVDGNYYLSLGIVGEKPKTYLKVNLGFKDGISENDVLSLIRIEAENSPITDLVSKFTEKSIGRVKVFKVYPNSSTMIFPSGEVNVEPKDKIKAFNPSGQLLEGTILSMESGIENYSKSTEKEAGKFFNQALILIEKGDWQEAQPLLEIILKFYPDFSNITKAEELYQALQSP